MGELGRNSLVLLARLHKTCIAQKNKLLLREDARIVTARGDAVRIKTTTTRDSQFVFG